MSCPLRICHFIKIWGTALYTTHIVFFLFASVHVWVMMVHLSWYSCIVTVHFTYHILMHLGFTQITAHHILSSVITCPLPLPYPLSFSMIARLGWTYPLFCMCGVQTLLTMPWARINRWGGESFCRYNCTIWWYAKINPIGTYHRPPPKNVSLTNKYLYKVSVLVYIYLNKCFFNYCVFCMASSSNGQFFLPFHNIQMILDFSPHKYKLKIRFISTLLSYLILQH
jgi:hypothetical protein